MLMGPNGISHEINYHYLSFIIYADMFVLALMAIKERKSVWVFSSGVENRKYLMKI